MKASFTKSSLIASAALFFIGCGGNNEPGDGTTEPAEMIASTPAAAQTVEASNEVEYTFSGLNDTQAYRITLVVEDNLTVTGNMGVFVDGDMNGAADAGASENTALIVSVNGTAQTGAKTVPAGTDDPSSPTGVFPSGGKITFEVEGVAAGTVHPVIYHNGGASTFLEIGAGGVPSETHVVAGAVIVQ